LNRSNSGDRKRRASITSGGGKGKGNSRANFVPDAGESRLDLRDVQRLRLSGLTDEQIADRLGLEEKGFAEWMKANEGLLKFVRL